jgi:LacI family transcriptional regulator
MTARSHQRPSIYDIAEEAGVSISMVSRVLNGSAPVAEEKRKRIEKLLKERNYVPNPVARSLARQDHNAFGVMLNNTGPEYSQLFSTPVLAGVSERCREAGRGMMLLWTTSQPSMEDTLDEATGRVDGILLFDVGLSAELAETALAAGLVCVSLNEPSPIPDIPSVQVDNHAGGRLAVEHLVAHGHRRIGLITGDLHLPSGHSRQQGALAALAAAGISQPDPWIVDALFNPDHARTAVQHMFGSGAGTRPTALFVASDVMAFAVVDELRSLGLSVPQDVSVVGFDDSLIAPLANPPLTTVAQPLAEMGRRAAELLEQAIAAEGEVADVVLPVSLRERESVACVASPAQ